MNYHNITHDDMLNGEGLRVVLWVAGCSHHCEGCHNPITWNPDGGIPFDEVAKKELFDELEKDYIHGITFTGGDPLHAKNRSDVFILMIQIKERFPNKTIWLYTGYKYEFINFMCKKYLKYVDVLVDGRFEKEKADVNYHWAGSTNQRVIDVKKLIKKGEVVLYEMS